MIPLKHFFLIASALLLFQAIYAQPRPGSVQTKASGFSSFNYEQIDSARKNMLDSIQQSRKRRDTALEIGLLLRSTNVLTNVFIRDSLKSFFARGMYLSKMRNDEVDSIRLLQYFAYAEMNIGDYPAALAGYLELLDLAEESNNDIKKERALVNLANFFSFVKDYDKWRQYAVQAKEMGRKNKDIFSEISLDGEISRYFKEIGKADSSKLYVDSSLLLAKRFFKGRVPVGVLDDIGTGYMELGYDSLSFNCLNECYLSLTNQHSNDNANFAETTLGLAKLYKRKAELDSTAFFARKAFEYAYSVPVLVTVESAAQLLADYYQQNNDYKTAFEFQRISTKCQGQSQSAGKA